MSTARWSGGPFRGGRGDRAVAGAIAVAALALVIGAVLDFVGGGADPVVSAVGTPAAPTAARTGEPIAFHRLMPDAMSGIGRLARLDGTVAAVESDAGFWVRDLRGHTVFVAASDPDDAAVVEPGDAVTVVGRIELVPPATVRTRGAVPEESGTGDRIVRDVELVPVDGGIDRLGR